jgi:hypothetical protein
MAALLIEASSPDRLNGRVAGERAFAVLKKLAGK